MDDSVLDSPWFVLLTTVVAFNTLIYVGLTLSKLIPWPHQARPERVRRSLERIGLRPDEEATMRKIPVARAPESDDPFKALSFATARKRIPQTLALMGGLVMLFAVTAAFLLKDLTFTAHIVEFLAGLTLLVAGVVLWYGEYKGLTMIRFFAAAATLLVLGLLIEGVVLEDLAPLAYTLVIMTAYMPILIDWNSALISGAMMLVAVVIAGFLYSLTTGLGFFVLAFSAVLVGGILMHLRLREIQELADERTLSASLATTDVLTGLLTKRGLLTVAPTLAANAYRADLPVFVLSVRVEQQAKAHSQYGTRYVEEVMRAVSEQVSSVTRTGDLVARWEDDELVILGQGAGPEAWALRARVEQGIEAGGVALGRWPVEVAVGSAAGDPAEATFEMILEAARAHGKQPSNETA